MGELNNQMLEHNRKYHANSPPRIDYYVEVPNFEPDFGSSSYDDSLDHRTLNSDEHYTNSNVCTEKIVIEKEISKSSFLNSISHRNPTSMKDSICELILSKETNNSYAEHLIKLSWVKNMDCSISWDDCDLFLKIVQKLLLSTRDANKKFMDIISLVQEREKEHAMTQREEITNLKLCVETLMEKNCKMHDLITRYASMDVDFKDWLQAVTEGDMLAENRTNFLPEGDTA